jgi:predicted RNase H-like nuclease (RuvC/YqgF family)
MPKAKGMEAVAEKVGRKQPVFAKKGARKPGVAIMIALGSPKKGPPPRPMEDDEEEEDYDLNASSQTDKIARLKAENARLKARLAEYEGEDMGEEEEGEEMDEEMDEEMED